MSEQHEQYRRKLGARMLQLGATLLGGFVMFATLFGPERGPTIIAGLFILGAGFLTCLVGRVWGQKRWYEGPLFAASPVALYLMLALTDVVLNRAYGGFLAGLTVATALFGVGALGSFAGGMRVRRRRVDASDPAA